MNSHLIASCKRELIEIYKYGLAAIKPDRLVKDAISFDNGNLVVKNIFDESKSWNYPLSGSRIHVVGGGKCALSMAEGIAELANQWQLTESFSHGCLSVPIMSFPAYQTNLSLQTKLQSIATECKFGAMDNLPDEDSVTATSYLLNCATEACREDQIDRVRSLFIVLISGGGSACLSSPRYISLAEKNLMIKDLVRKGADIVELNKVRRCFSHVKGGNLARHIKSCNPNAQIVSLIISDVINDPMEFIASGPTFVNTVNSSLNDEMTVISNKYGLKFPELINDSETFNWSVIENESVINTVIGNNLIALRAVIDKARDFNFHVKYLANNLSGPTREIMEKILLASLDQSASKILTISGGEAIVQKLDGESWGSGGRNQEMALDYMISRLSQSSRKSQNVDMFLAGTTDGQDGPTDVAACLASYAEWSMSKDFNLLELLDAKKRHDSFNFWTERKPDWLIKLGPTGTNVMDLYLLATISGIENNLVTKVV